VAILSAELRFILNCAEVGLFAQTLHENRVVFARGADQVGWYAATLSPCEGRRKFRVSRNPGKGLLFNAGFAGFWEPTKDSDHSACQVRLMHPLFSGRIDFELGNMARKTSEVLPPESGLQRQTAPVAVSFQEFFRFC
jgi:hypothetical protein